MDDPYIWAAHYNDGTMVCSRDENDQVTAHYADIDREKLLVFQVLIKATRQPVFSVKFKKGEGHKLIWRSRHLMKDNIRVDVGHIVAYKGKWVALVHHSGQVIMNNGFIKGDAWFAPPGEPQGGEA